MLAQARTRATDFGDHSFDTVVCTFSLCAVPDERLAVTEMIRVLAPGGTLLLADHVAGTARLTRVVQRLLELVTIPLGEEHFRRRPLLHVQAAGLTIEHHERFTFGMVERLAARALTP
jgi:ubiquinone/menaquinone biosynthesis C-methylase UbiE